MYITMQEVAGSFHRDDDDEMHTAIVEIKAIMKFLKVFHQEWQVRRNCSLTDIATGTGRTWLVGLITSR